jgi:hypothetical protein
MEKYVNLAMIPPPNNIWAWITPYSEDTSNSLRQWIDASG